MATHEENLTRLIGVLKSHAQPDMNVLPDTMLASDLGIDSAQLMEILLEVEDEFDVSIPLNLLPNIYTVDDLAREIGKLTENAQ